MSPGRSDEHSSDDSDVAVIDKKKQQKIMNSSSSNNNINIRNRSPSKGSRSHNMKKKDNYSKSKTTSVE